MSDRLNSLLFQSVDIRTLALVRILVGLWIFIDFVGMMLIGYVQEAYIDAQMNFPFYGFEWIRALPGIGMYLVYTLIGLAALGIILGYRYKLAVGIALVCQTYVFMIDIVYTLNKFYLLLLVLTVFLFVPANRFWSLDVKRGSVEQSASVPRWMILVFQFMLVLIYTYSGLSKLTPDWLTLHQPLTNFLKNKWPFELLHANSKALIIELMTYGGLLFDLSIGTLLILRKTRLFGHIWQTGFHFLNFTFLAVGSLSIFMCILTWLLFPTDSLKRRIGLVDFEEAYIPSLKIRRLIKVALISFALIMLFLPHRHYLIDNNVNWTEKGHRFSWRLMTRTKLGSLSTFVVTNNASGQVWAVDPRDYLTGRQYRKMSAETDLVIVFAHWLEEEWGRKGFNDVKVQAIVNTSLNGREVRLLLDSEVDLTKVERSVWRDPISTPFSYQ